MSILLACLLVLFLLFGFTVFRGAPYIPTHARQVEVALDLLSLQPGRCVVDLGSGDGIFLQAAAKRGLRAYGYEINPLLCIIAWLRCIRYGKLVKVLWRDFWLSELPVDMEAVFIFAAGPFMKQLTRKLEKAAYRRGRALYVASYGFAMPGHQPITSREGVWLYKL